MDDATFLAIMRRCLHGLAATAGETERRHLLGIAEAFEKRYGIQPTIDAQPVTPRWLDAETHTGADTAA